MTLLKSERRGNDGSKICFDPAGGQYDTIVPYGLDLVLNRAGRLTFASSNLETLVNVECAVRDAEEALRSVDPKVLD